jgi:2'-5' RNA ligase
MSETWRLFIALPIPLELQRTAARVQDRLRKAGADVSFPRPENLHFTLAFLGYTFPEHVPALQAGLDRAASGLSAFMFQVAGIGLFGPLRHPRVVWAGVPAPPDVLARLHDSVLAMLAELKFTIGKTAWQPHLTLGRIRSARGLAGLTDMVDSLKGESLGECPVERVELMRSHLDQPRPCYTVLHSTPLKGT